MFKLNRWFGSFLLIGSVLFFISCEKEAVIDNITSNDGVQARLAYTDKGYTEVEVNPIVKITCYFSNWDKDVMTPVSGLFDYYDTDDNWVASIDFGDGSCDEIHCDSAAEARRHVASWKSNNTTGGGQNKDAEKQE